MPIEFIFILFAGLALGSFVTCASYRLPLEQDIVKKPSFCPKCNTKLGFKDLWPLFSWLFSSGKCRHCGAKVSARYPLTEIVTATVCMLIYLRYGFTPQTLILILLAVALLIMIVTDLEHYIIPDQIHLFLLPLGVAYHTIVGTPWQDALAGLLLGLGIGLSLHYGYRWIRKKEGLGFGDVKFFAVVGLWLTPLPIVPFLFYSGLLGIVTAFIWRVLGKGKLFPFGPALAIALFACIAYPEIPNLFLNMGKFLK